MRKLKKIINMVQSGECPDYEELRYAICAMKALATFDGRAISKLAQAELAGKEPVFVNSAVFQHEERFNRNKRAFDTDPKTYIGWNDDPDNPGFIERRKAAIKLVRKTRNGAAVDGTEGIGTSNTTSLH